MTQHPAILFVHNDLASFVRADLDLLRERYRVTDLYLPSRRFDPRAVLAAVGRHDLVFGWFASWHTFLPVLFARLLGKPSLLVVGGYDLANMPEIGYGHQRGGLKKWVSRRTMGMATQLVTNARYSQAEAARNAGLRAERLRVVYHGVADPFGALPAGPRRRVALTVGNVDRGNLYRKGHEPFVRAAALLPDVRFILVGAWKDDAIDHLRAIATPNVQFAGRIDDAALLAHYRAASVYVQASAHEGFGLSLAEGMLAGCVPVVSRAGAIPEVVADAGIYIEGSSTEALAAGIAAGLQAEQALRHTARERILQSFPMAERGRILWSLVDDLMVK
ncbi:MAG: glycosyltransferase [Kouleothrix sp.]|nr:glycosyltransferase [Kouleothrix sp.]